MRTYFIETWGCQMNQHDSEILEGGLRNRGLVAAASADEADLVLLNTCSVRSKPVQKVNSRIGQLARLARPPVIGLCGCVAEHEGRSLLDRSAAVRFVMGPGQVHRIGEAVDAVVNGQRAILTGFPADRPTAPPEVVRSSRTRGRVTVVEGCNQYCSYCVVPYVRGPEVSRPFAEVLAEVEELARSGLREVELLGQTINAYRCPVSGLGFAALLRSVASVGELDRVRYITCHPRYFGSDLLDVVAATPKVSRYLHLPCQSGSDSVLERMNRGYARADYLALVDRIRAAAPGINLSSDFIVGFPGETEEDFQATLDLIRRVRFGQVFAFAFSPRLGTRAAALQPLLPSPEKKDRLQSLLALADGISHELNSSLVGQRVPVLIDGHSRRSSGHWQGRGEDNRVVNFPKMTSSQVGDIVTVQITRAGPHSLFGEQVADGASLPVLAS